MAVSVRFSQDMSEAQKEGARDMRVLRLIRKWLHELWGSGMNFPAGIDSHKWESKIEILGNLSSRCC
jgi:hypothetical protein